MFLLFTNNMLKCCIHVYILFVNNSINSINGQRTISKKMYYSILFCWHLAYTEQFHILTFANITREINVCLTPTRKALKHHPSMCSNNAPAFDLNWVNSPFRCQCNSSTRRERTWARAASLAASSLRMRTCSLCSSGVGHSALCVTH